MRLLPLMLLAACANPRPPAPAPSGEAWIGNALEILDKNPIAADQPLKVTPLFENPDHSVSLVQVNTRLAPHYHAKHDEVAYVLRGGGTFRVGPHERAVKPGDVMVIPRGAVHSFENEGEAATSVLSVFTPRFDGQDRIFLPQK